jgi:uncharacterized OB-fold protein
MSQLVAGYRAGLRRGELLIQRCGACGNAQMYPRYRCTRCQSAELGYEPAVGRGKLLTYTVVRAVPPKGFENDLPYALGVVRLEEGVQLLGRLLPDRFGDWRSYDCDSAVEFAPASVEEIDGRPVAWFRLAEEEIQ